MWQNLGGTVSNRPRQGNLFEVFFDLATMADNSVCDALRLFPDTICLRRLTKRQRKRHPDGKSSVDRS
jgi:hypothetical protein